jgi:uncharacterized membrane protein YhhN
MKKISLALFLLVSVGELTSQVVDLPWLHTMCKPALLPLLLVYYVVSAREAGGSMSMLVVAALVLSWLGDVLLMGEGQSFFIFGLVSFLLAHVTYILAYRQHQQADDSKALRGIQKIRYGFPLVFAGVGLVMILYPRLSDLRIPVMVYAGVITVMTLTGLFRFGRTNASSFAQVFAGAILFMMSDSLLAVNKFLEPLAYSGLWIMLTYLAAQWFIVRGLLAHR